ncbi:hypothetical protein E2C01_004395 [Portunus trituberculatus]|uniref:Uncharacterized protein n=1 Tax=Portunus trituberculatus TaxID=210409 RepID=A0A5B7CS91_PORTR|nr:hypothetical protein [Portunus trituberculatus]
MLITPCRALPLHNFLHNVSAPSEAAQRRGQQTTCSILSRSAPGTYSPPRVRPSHALQSASPAPGNGYIRQQVAGATKHPQDFAAQCAFTGILIECLEVRGRESGAPSPCPPPSRPGELPLMSHSIFTQRATISNLQSHAEVQQVPGSGEGAARGAPRDAGRPLPR